MVGVVDLFFKADDIISVMQSELSSVLIKTRPKEL